MPAIVLITPDKFASNWGELPAGSGYTPRSLSVRDSLAELRPNLSALLFARPSFKSTFLAAADVSGCDAGGARPQLWDTTPPLAPGRRVFCLNPRIASLAPADSFPVDMANAVRGFNTGRLAFRPAASADR